MGQRISAMASMLAWTCADLAPGDTRPGRTFLSTRAVQCTGPPAFSRWPALLGANPPRPPLTHHHSQPDLAEQSQQQNTHPFFSTKQKYHLCMYACVM